MGDVTAWLETGEGVRWPVGVAASIGRAQTNQVVIEDGRVSRRHALVHRQDETEYWVIDLGSGNGTYVNGRRVTMPTRVRDRDRVAVGGIELVFRQPAAPPSRLPRSQASEQTIIQVKTMHCWLLVADIKGSTALAQRLPTTELAQLVGRWMSMCKEIIESRGGAINKYLGDGFLAYWYFDSKRGEDVVGAITALAELQRTGDGPPFRLALHQGMLSLGGGGSTGEDSLGGPEVIRVFRMEKLAASLGRDVLLSEEAYGQLKRDLSLADLGLHGLPGFTGDPRRYYTLA